jgi:hypothetical protein
MDAVQSASDADKEIGVMKIPCVVFREYRRRIKVVEERGDGRVNGRRLW